MTDPKKQSQVKPETSKSVDGLQAFYFPVEGRVIRSVSLEAAKAELAKQLEAEAVNTNGGTK